MTLRALPSVRDLSGLSFIEVSHIHPLSAHAQIGLRCASNDVNFAERPLAGIHAKLTKLCDNFVVAMRGFPCAIDYAAVSPLP